MRFIELTGRKLAMVINDGEMREEDLRNAGVFDETIVRVNEQGDIEVRRPDDWDCIGGLLGNYEERIKSATQLDWV